MSRRDTHKSTALESTILALLNVWPGVGLVVGQVGSEASVVSVCIGVAVVPLEGSSVVSGEAVVQGSVGINMSLRGHKLHSCRSLM